MAAPKPAKKAVKGTLVTCHASIVQQLGASDTGLVPVPTQGAYIGTVSCDKAFGAGMQAAAFKLQDDGSLRGANLLYFDTGTVRGRFTLVPADSSPTYSATFAAVDYTGTITVAGGTGAFKGAQGKGTLKCTSPDSLHLSCTEKLRMTKV